MGFLDDLKKGLGFDDDNDAVSHAQKQADEAKKKADEAAEKARKESGDKAAEAKKEADEAAAEAAKKKAEYDKAAAEAAGRSGTPAPAPAPKAPAPAPAPKAPAPAPKKAAPALRVHTVKKGDTLSEIGEKYGVSWKAIAKLNNIDNPDLIFPGQKFKIPN